MHVVAMLPFVLLAAGIAALVLRADAARHRHASIRPPDLEPPTLPGRGPAPTPRRALTFEGDVAPLFANVRSNTRVARDRAVMAARPQLARAVAAARPQLARAEAQVRAHPNIALAVLGAVAFVVMLLAILGQPHEATPRAAAEPASRNASNAGAAAAPKTSVAASNAPQTTPSAAAPPTGEAGAPLSGDGLIAAWTTAGLKVEAAEQLTACGGAKSRAYRANGSQVAVVFVYASPAAMSADWAVERGSPLTFRSGPCLPAGSVTYWNQNIVLSFPQLADAGVKQQMSDALLRMTAPR